MPNKLLLSWNSHPAHEREIIHHVSELVNRVSPLGLELRDAWYTAYGEAPQILLGFVLRRGSDKRIDNIVTSNEWNEILLDFQEYITDYEQRIVKATVGFQF